MHLIMEIGL